jgi:hypothetical protein
MKAGMILTVIILIVLNLIVLGGHGGRGGDYYESQTQDDTYDR